MGGGMRFFIGPRLQNAIILIKIDAKSRYLAGLSNATRHFKTPSREPERVLALYSGRQYFALSRGFSILPVEPRGTWSKINRRGRL
jgi:hypothetical protein